MEEKCLKIACSCKMTSLYFRHNLVPSGHLQPFQVLLVQLRLMMLGPANFSSRLPNYLSNYLVASFICENGHLLRGQEQLDSTHIHYYHNTCHKPYCQLIQMTFLFVLGIKTCKSGYFTVSQGKCPGGQEQINQTTDFRVCYLESNCLLLSQYLGVLSE